MVNRRTSPFKTPPPTGAPMDLSPDEAPGLPSNVENLRHLLQDGFVMLEIDSTHLRVTVVLAYDDLRVTLVLGETDAEEILEMGLKDWTLPHRLS